MAGMGLSTRELARVRGRLVEFAEEVFVPLARSDQRRWGEENEDVEGEWLVPKRLVHRPLHVRPPASREPGSAAETRYQLAHHTRRLPMGGPARSNLRGQARP